MPMPGRTSTTSRQRRRGCRTASRSSRRSNQVARRLQQGRGTPHLPYHGGNAMRKLFPIVLSGFLAVSFSQLAAAQSTTAQGSTGANVGADVNTKAPSADTSATGSADTKADAKIGSGTRAGANADTRAGAGASADVDKNAKPKGTEKQQNQDKQSSAGGTMDKQQGSTKADEDASAAGGSSP